VLRKNSEKDVAAGVQQRRLYRLQGSERLSPDAVKRKEEGRSQAVGRIWGSYELKGDIFIGGSPYKILKLS